MTRLCVPKRRQRQTATDRFGQANHVGLDAEVLGGAAPAQLRAGFYFVEDQQCAVFVAEIPKPCRKPGCGMQRPTFIMIGSKMMAAISFGFSLKRRSTVCEIVEGRDHHVRDAGLRNAESSGTGFGFLMSPKSSCGGCGFTLTRAAS